MKYWVDGIFLGVSSSYRKVADASAITMLYGANYRSQAHCVLFGGSATQKAVGSESLEFSTSCLLYDTQLLRGGAIGDRIDTQEVYLPEPIQGVSGIVSLRNQIGTGVLTIEKLEASANVSWKGNGAGAPITRSMSSSGMLELRHATGSKYGTVKMEIDLPKLVSGDYKMVISNTPNAILPTTTASEAANGSEKYLGVYVYNENDDIDFSKITIKVDEQPMSGVEVYIGVAPEGANSDMETLPDNVTPPSGVAFGTSVTIDGLTSHGRIGLWVKVANLPYSTVAKVMDWVTIEVEATL